MPRRTRRALNRIRARTWSSWNWTNSGISFKKKNKLWIWLAFDRSGQRLVDWECGGRDAATLNRLLERLNPGASSCTVQMIMGLTTRSCRLGDTISARMKRWRLSGSTAGCVIGQQPVASLVCPLSACVVSKALEMVDATIALFAAYHVNRTAAKLTLPLVA